MAPWPPPERSTSIVERVGTVNGRSVTGAEPSRGQVRLHGRAVVALELDHVAAYRAARAAGRLEVARQLGQGGLTPRDPADDGHHPAGGALLDGDANALAARRAGAARHRFRRLGLPACGLATRR